MRLGDMYPDIAGSAGFDPLQEQQLAAEALRWDGSMVTVTFQDPPARKDGKRDPIGYLPPEYREYAVVDRDHRHRVQVGETWVCEVFQPVGATMTKFLIPRFRLTLQLLLDLKEDMICVVADTIAQKDERLAKQFAEKLPDPKRFEELEKELAESRAHNTELTEKAVEMESTNASLEVQIEELKNRLAAARAAPPAGAKPDQHQERLPVVLENEVPMSQPALSARRIQGDVVESASFTHEAYEAHFTPDLTRILVRPSRSGASCRDGRVHITGIARVDTTPAPRSYRLTWDERLSGFIIYLDQVAPPKEASQ